MNELHTQQLVYHCTAPGLWGFQTTQTTPLQTTSSHTLSLVVFHSLRTITSSCPTPTSLISIFFFHSKLFWPIQICAESWKLSSTTACADSSTPAVCVRFSWRACLLSSDSVRKFVDGKGKSGQRSSSKPYVDEELVLIRVEVSDVSAQEKAFCHSNLPNTTSNSCFCCMCKTSEALLL